jgi:hypothetical protein
VVTDLNESTERCAQCLAATCEGTSGHTLPTTC